MCIEYFTTKGVQNMHTFSFPRLKQLQELQKSQGWIPLRHRPVQLRKEIVSKIEGRPHHGHKDYYPCTEKVDKIYPQCHPCTAGSIQLIIFLRKLVMLLLNIGFLQFLEV